MKLQNIKSGLCKIAYFFGVINICHINLDVKEKDKRVDKVNKSIFSLSPEDEERHFFNMALSKSSENVLSHRHWSS